MNIQTKLGFYLRGICFPRVAALAGPGPGPGREGLEGEK